MDNQYLHKDKSIRKTTLRRTPLSNRAFSEVFVEKSIKQFYIYIFLIKKCVFLNNVEK
jgi:hypothetical protein